MHKYGMKERGFGVGCQPKGFVKWEDASQSQRITVMFGMMNH